MKITLSNNNKATHQFTSTATDKDKALIDIYNQCVSSKNTGWFCEPQTLHELNENNTLFHHNDKILACNIITIIH